MVREGDARGVRVPPEECARMSRDLLDWEVPDLKDVEAVKRTVRAFYDLCEKYNTRPLISCLCLMLGTSREELVRTMKGQRTPFARRVAPEALSYIQRVLALLEVSWEQTFVNNGFSNPATGIFFAKNNYGYKDQTENITIRLDQSALLSASQLKEKYLSAIPIEPDSVDPLPPSD